MSAATPGAVEPEVQQWVGYTLEAGLGDIVCDRGTILHWAESVADANPLWWDEQVADALTDGWIAPPSMLSVWMRPLMFKPAGWSPTGEAVADLDAAAIRPLEAHFRLKDGLGLPEGVVTYNEIEFHEPVRPGDRIATTQTVSQISAQKTNRLGTGRYWRIDVTYTKADPARPDEQAGAVVGIETYNMFGYARSGAGGAA